MAAQNGAIDFGFLLGFNEPDSGGDCRLIVDKFENNYREKKT